MRLRTRGETRAYCAVVPAGVARMKRTGLAVVVGKGRRRQRHGRGARACGGVLYCELTPSTDRSTLMPPSCRTCAPGVGTRGGGETWRVKAPTRRGGRAFRGSAKRLLAQQTQLSVADQRAGRRCSC
eukprot:6183320-Pleurochrysis_carterae.AAC.2